MWICILKKFKLLIDLVSYMLYHLIFHHTYKLYMLLSGAEHASVFKQKSSWDLHKIVQGCTTITRPKVASVTVISQNSGLQL